MRWRKPYTERIKQHPHARWRKAYTEHIKLWIEIAALLIGGAYGGYEFIYRGITERQRGESRGWAIVDLSSDVVPGETPGDVYVHLSAKFVNTSKRTLNPLFTTWVLRSIADAHEQEADLAYRNTTRIVTLFPGETARDGATIRINSKHKAVVARVKIYEREGEDGGKRFKCILDPKAMVEDIVRLGGDVKETEAEYIRKTDRVPHLCRQDPDHPGVCSSYKGGCEYSYAEKVIWLHDETEKNPETEHTDAGG